MPRTKPKPEDARQEDAFAVGAKIKYEGQKGIDEGVNLGNLGILLAGNRS